MTTRDPNPVPFTVQSLQGFQFSDTATSGTTTPVPLGTTHSVLDSNDRNKGIRISAGDKQIVVYGLEHHEFSTDAYLALPCSTGITEDEYVYYGITYYSGFGVSQLLFVGCEDGTTINVGTETISLNEMETYLYERPSDLTGTRVVSDKPISFFSGHECTTIPEGVNFCDFIIEQLPSTVTWGTRFFSASLMGRSSGDIYRILTSQPSTTVTFTCSTLSQPSTYTLATEGSWETVTTPDNSFCSIESDQPLLVVQFALGRASDGVGDPSMMMLPPIEQYSNNYAFNNLPGFSTNFITIFASPEHYQPDNILVDDVSQEGNTWTAVQCADSTVCGYTAYVSLIPGSHRLYHTDGSASIGVSVYGFNTDVSYAYPGGMNLAPIQGTVKKIVFINSFLQLFPCNQLTGMHNGAL